MIRTAILKNNTPTFVHSRSRGGNFVLECNMKLCIVRVCMNKHKGYGYCVTHLQKARKSGLFGPPRICKADTCDKPVHSRGYCDKHYRRLLAGNNPEDPSSLDKRVAIMKDDCALLTLGPNGRDGYAIVDIEDTERLSKYNWFLSHGYPSRSMTLGRNTDSGKYINYQQRLHREVMNLQPYDERDVDHQDTNKLNNRKANLRFCNQLDNNRNKPRGKNNKSGHKGVSWKKANQKWCVQIQTGFNVQHIGLFEDKDEAGHIYNQFAEQIFGEFAHLNKIPSEKNQ